MKKIAFIFTTLCLLYSCKPSSEEIRICKKIDKDWKFVLSDIPDAKEVNFDDSDWRNLDIPHDWSIELPIDSTNPSGTAGGFSEGGIGFYRKNLNIPKEYSGKKIFIKFDGIYKNSDVWVNGSHVGHRAYGYATHFYDITKEIIPGKDNIVTVRVDNSYQPADRWYSGSGIYRHAWLVATSQVYIPIWGTYITTPEVSKEKSLVNVETEIKNEFGENKQIELSTEILDPSGNKVVEKKQLVTVPANSDGKYSENIEIINPSIWDITTPNIYKAISVLKDNGEIIDRYETEFGIRSVDFTSEKGFLLNGKQLKLKGVNLHHDATCLGAAVPSAIWDYRLDILKDLGINAIRLSHNPHMEELITLCDHKGIMVFDEINDKWGIPWLYVNNSTDTAFFEEHKETFRQNYLKDLADFIDRDKNHPSVIIWSIGNETLEQRLNVEEGRVYLNKMVEYIRENEPSRKVTLGMHPGYEERGEEVPSSYLNDLDVLSYNYRTHQFTDWKKKYSGLICIASETKQYNNEVFVGWDTLSYSNNSWWHVKKNDFIAGQFIWAGIEYLGESRAWPDKGLRGCIVYSNGIPKTNAYFFKSVYSEDPMVHIAVHDDSLANMLENSNTWQVSWWHPPVSDHWNFEEKTGKSIKVYTYTNCETVELFLNGKSLGEKKSNISDDGVVRWDFAYSTGVLEAIGKNSGKEVTGHKLVTAGIPSQIELKPNKTELTHSNDDAIVVNVAIVDSANTVCPYASNLVKFSVKGPARIIGVDNGDMADHYDWKGNKVKVMKGQAIVILASDSEKTGKVILSATSGNMTSETVINVIN